MFERRLGDDADRIPSAGEEVVIGELGNHCLGSEFRDGEHLVTPELEREVEQLSRTVEGFFFGRYDLRGDSHAAIQAGRFKVIELNGVSSEITNIYDPDRSLGDAYRTLFGQWSMAFRIGEENRRRGTEPTPLSMVIRHLLEHFAPGGRRWARD